MDLQRRDILISSLGLGLSAAAVSLLPGCKLEQPVAGSGRPGADLGTYGQKRPIPIKQPITGTTRPIHQAQVVTPTPITAPAGATLNIGNLAILPRAQWTSMRGPISNKINPMNGIKHITVHHEGWHVVDFDDRPNTIDRLEKIRAGHTRSVHDGGRGWSDIGYHFIIDRAGRIWEGRNLAYQGAHVTACNENNLGIMCLGNFDDQTPSQAQLNSLVSALKNFKAHFRVPMGEIFTHQEWKVRCPSTSTRCPGTNLQSKMAGIRRTSVIG